MGARIAFDHVSLTYPLPDGSTLHAVNDASFVIEPGELIAIKGPSGSSKSSLLHLMGAMDRPSSGRVEVDDRDLTTLSARAAADYRATVGFVFQQFHLIPALTVLDNVCVPLMGREHRDRRQRAKEALGSVGLESRSEAYPAELSGGQRQRVAIARALVVEPQLILADEPTGQLDTATSAQIVQLLSWVHAQTGATVCLASHDPSVVSAGQRTLQICDGVVTF